MTSRGARSSSRAPLALLALAALTAVVVLIEGRGTTFFFDDWDLILGRRGHSVGTFLDAQNGNLSLVPIVLFKTLLQLFGGDGYAAWRVVLVVLHLLVVGLVWRLLRPRVGERGAVVGAALVLVLGRSADNLVWPAQFGYVTATVGGLVALVGVDRRTRGGDLLVLGGLLLGLASSSNALPLYVAVAVSLLLVRADWRRLWAVVVPAVLYALWSLGWGASQFDVANVPKTPEFAATMAATAAGGAVGLTADFGRAIAVVAVAALVAWLVRGGRATPRLWGALAGLVALWVLSGFARASIEDPAAPRYVYVAVVLGVLALAEVVHASRPTVAGRELLAAPRAAIAAAALVAFCALTGWGALHARALDLRGYADTARARVGAVELAAAYVPPTFAVVPEQPQVTAGPALSVERDFGGLGDSRREIARDDLTARNAADDTLRRVGAIALTAGGRRAATPDPPAVVELSGAAQRLVTGVPCSELTPSAPGASVAVAGLPGQRFELETRGAAEVRAWRFGAAPATVTAIAPRGRSTVTLRPDAVAGDAVRPWVVQVALADVTRVCVAG